MEIISPKYSFVKFNSTEEADSCCEGSELFCIPVIEENDLFFQLIVSGANLAEGTTIFDAAPENVRLLLLSGTGNTAGTVSANTLRDWTTDDTLAFEKYRTKANQVTFVWKEILKDIKTLVECDECFQLAVIADVTGDPENPLIGISNCFIRKCDNCYSSILEYYNDEDYADFKYCNVENGVNRVRLPIHLLKPKYIDEKSVYRKSTGAIKQTKGLLTKEYPAETEYFPEYIHDKITVALGHDNVSIEDKIYTGGISKSGEYVADWDQDPTACMAPATFKVNPTPYAIKNNNCADCEEVDLTACAPVGFSGDPLPDAVKGIPYNATIELTGTPPFIITATNKPAWMNITMRVVGISFSNKIDITGTPDAEASDVPVEVTITNCNGTNTYDFADTIDVTKECAAVVIDKTPLPSAEQGVAYTHNIPLAGDAPFTFELIAKPDWMTIGIVGSNVQITGTPTASGVVDVIFNVTNCDGNGTDSGSFTISVSTFFFYSTTDITGDDLYSQERETIKGIAGETARVKVSTYTVANVDGKVFVDGSQVFLDDEFDVLMDGTGFGSFIAKVSGDPLDHPSAVLARFKIISVTAGTIGSPDEKQISKVF